MNLTASDIDTIAMLRFEPVRGSHDYKCGMHMVKIEIVRGDYDDIMSESNKTMRDICDRMKKAPSERG